jgi:hypothetical protein
MTTSEIGLLSLPLIAAVVVSAFAWSAALLAVRRGRKLQARRLALKQSSAQTSPNDAADAEVEQALQNLSLAIAKRAKTAAVNKTEGNRANEFLMRRR